MDRTRRYAESSVPGLSDRWKWPLPPFPCQMPPSLGEGPAEPCLIETVGRDAVEGMLVKMDPSIGIAMVRIAGRALEVSC